MSIHCLHSMREDWWLNELKISKHIHRWQRRWWHLGLSGLHVDHGLLHSLKQLCLHIQHMLKSRWRGWLRVGILVVLPIVVFGIVVVVNKIENTQKNDSRGEAIVENPQR
jgi:hypothetical protein